MRLLCMLPVVSIKNYWHHVILINSVDHNLLKIGPLLFLSEVCYCKGKCMTKEALQNRHICTSNCMRGHTFKTNINFQITSSAPSLTGNAACKSLQGLFHVTQHLAEACRPGSYYCYSLLWAQSS